MLTGKKLREARKKKNMTAAQAAKAAGVSVNTVYTWETNGVVQARNKKALSKLLAAYGLSLAEKLEASLEAKPKAKKKAAAKMTRKKSVTLQADPNWKAPSGATHVMVVGVGGGGGGGDKHGPADVAELVQMLGFFMGDQPRRSNLGRLLKAAVRCSLTIHGLERAIDGNG